MKVKILLNITSAIIAGAGIYMITYYSNWQTTLGVILLIWSNNFDYKKED